MFVAFVRGVRRRRTQSGEESDRIAGRQASERINGGREASSSLFIVGVNLSKGMEVDFCLSAGASLVYVDRRRLPRSRCLYLLCSPARLLSLPSSSSSSSYSSSLSFPFRPSPTSLSHDGRNSFTLPITSCAPGVTVSVWYWPVGRAVPIYDCKATEHVAHTPLSAGSPPPLSLPFLERPRLDSYLFSSSILPPPPPPLFTIDVVVVAAAVAAATSFAHRLFPPPGHFAFSNATPAPHRGGLMVQDSATHS